MGYINWHKVIDIDDTPPSVSKNLVWALTFMVGLTISIVGFFGNRLVNQVDDMDKALQTSREVQASQVEINKGLQRDIDNNGKEIEKLKSEVDRLKETNAVLKAKAGIPLTQNHKPPKGGFLVCRH